MLSVRCWPSWAIHWADRHWQRSPRLPSPTLSWPGTASSWTNRVSVLSRVSRSDVPVLPKELEDLVIRMARENRSWGYDRIVGALRNLGYRISDQTVGNILKRHGLPPAPERKKTTTWREFI